MRKIIFPSDFQFKLALVFTFCLVSLGVTFKPAAVAAQMPPLDQTRLVSPSLSGEPIEVQSGPICLDSSQRYAVVNTLGARNKVTTIIDLQTGQQVKEFKLNERGQVVSLSPDLKYLLFRPSLGGGLKVLDVSNGLQEVREIPISSSRSRNQGGQYYFVSSDRIVMHETTGKKGFSLVDATNGRLLFSPVKQQQYVDRSFQNSLSVTPDRNFIVFQETLGSKFGRPSRRHLKAGNILKFVSVANGAVAGQLKLDADDDECQRAKLSPDGKRVVCLADGKKSSVVSGFSTADGSRKFKIQITPETGQVRWLGNDHFLIGNMVVSFSQQRVLARLKGFEPRHIIESTGQAIFVNRYDGANYLTVENVLDELREPLQATKASAASILKPGDPVSVVYEMPDDAPISGFDQKLEYAVYKSLTESGFQLKANAKAKLTIVVDERATGKLISIASGIEDTSPGPRFGHIKTDRFTEEERFTVPEVEVIFRWTLTRQAGIPTEPKELRVGFPTKLQYSDREGLIDYARKWRWQKVLEELQGQFASANVDFNLSTIAFKSGPDEAWLADAKKTRLETARLEREAKAKIDKEARDQKRQARIEASARKHFERMKSSRFAVMLNDSQSLLDWNFKPTAMPQLNDPIGVRPIAIKAKTGSTVSDVRFSTAKNPQAAVLIRKKGELRVDRYDLAKRKQLANTPVERSTKLYDFRPDGKVWMVSKGRDAKTLQIYQADRGSTDKMVAELDLSSEKDSIKNAWFTGVKTILTLSRSQMSGYELPSGKLIFQLPASQPSASFLDYQPALSADRRYVVCSSDRGLDVRLTADGSVACELKVSDLHKNIGSMAFSNDSKRLAVLTQLGVEIFDMESGKPLQQVCVDKLRGQIRWINSGLVLCGHKVVSLDTGEVVWEYGRFAKSPFFDGPDLGWVVGATKDRQKVLQRHSIPEPSVLKTIEAFEKEQPVMLSAGDQVDIEIVGEEKHLLGLEDDLVTGLKASLKEAGYDVVPGAKAKIVVTISPPAKGHFGEIGIENGDNYIVTRKYNYKALLQLESNGQKRTIRSIQIGTQAMDYAIDWSVENPQAEFEQNWKAELVRRITGMPFPDRFVEPSSGPLGTTRIDWDGKLTTTK